jgi:hypothetical protein
MPGSPEAREAFEKLISKTKGGAPMSLGEIKDKLSPEMQKFMEKIEELRRRQAAPAGR